MADGGEAAKHQIFSRLFVETSVAGAPNGVISLKTGELRDGDPDDRITMQLGVEYDPDATCPRWEAFVQEVLDDEALATLSEAFEMEDVKLGAGLHRKYERIAAELERAWAA